MTLSAKTALLLAPLLLAGAPAAMAQVPAADAAADAAALAADPAQSAHDRLFALFAETNEASLERSPINAMFRGDMRYADRLGDFFSYETFAAARQDALNALARLRQIDRAALSQTDRIAYDTFEYYQTKAARENSPEILALTLVRPLNHFSGVHTFYPTFASGQGAAPFKTVEDYENNLKRHAQYAGQIDKAIARFREGLESGVLATSLTTRNMIEQLDTQLAQPAGESPLYGPMGMFPEEFSEADKARLTQAHRAAITDQIYPALKRLRDFLADEYLPQARESVGLSQMKGGTELYASMIESTTTLPLTADYLHDLGLSEVARITAEMEKARAEMGFEASLGEFFDWVRTDPRFKRKSREELTGRYYEIGRMVDGLVPQFFSTLPKAPLEIRPYEEFREKFEAGGSYQPGAPDGSRPGVFYFNAYDLPSRTTPGEVTLYLHEGAPGHHFQISLAQENEALPDFMRFEFPTAYVEGWALYAETLGYDMGLYEDPVARFGTLDDEMLRAMRLVVDTGIHAKGWSRDQAIEYMMSNSSMGRTDATAEVERYIAIPSQALAYKVGALKIQELRRKAEAALGDSFDIRKFHEQVLGTGALPLPVLEQKIDDWIAASQTG